MKDEEMKTAATRFLLAALVCGVACERLLQDVPLVGVDPTSSPSSMESMTGTGEDELDVESAIEFDDQITGKKQNAINDDRSDWLFRDGVLITVYLYRENEKNLPGRK